MLIVPPLWLLVLVEVAAGDGLDVLIGGNTIRMPEPEFADAAAAAAFFGCSPTALATALMIALGKLVGAEPDGVVEPFVLLLLLVFAVMGAASEVDCCWAYSVL